MNDKTLLNPPDSLETSVPNTVSSVQSIDLSVGELEALPNYSSSVVPSLFDHIATAKQNGNLWQHTVRPSIAATLSDISNFSNLFNQMYPALVDAAEQIENNASDGIANFQKILIQLQIATKDISTRVASIENPLNNFENLVFADIRNFKNDEQQAVEAKKSNEQIKKSAQSQLEELEAEKKKKQIIFDATVLFSPLAAATEKLIEALTGQIEQKQKRIAEAEEAVQQAQQACAFTQQAIQATQSYESIVGSISNSVNSMINGWEILDANFDTLLESESIDTFNVFTEALLETVKADWENLSQQARKL